MARFDHITNINARDVGRKEPGHCVITSKANAPEKDCGVYCDSGRGAMRVSISYSMLDRRHGKDGAVPVAFGAGIVAPVDPLFARRLRQGYGDEPAARQGPYRAWRLWRQRQAFRVP